MFRTIKKGSWIVFLMLLVSVTAFAQSVNPDLQKFFNAASNGDTETMEALLAKGVDINAKNICGCTALTLAAENGHIATVKDLLAKGADVNATNNDRYNALRYAKKGNYSEIIQLLIKAGANEVLSENITFEEKPNVYLYPTKKQSVTVELVFPVGGKVLISDPLYRSGWTINASPDGAIDYESKKYDCLFYEAQYPDSLPRNTGYIIATSRLESFFRKNMQSLGFIDKEIEDFVKYWIPKFVDYKFYEIKPLVNEELNDRVQLNITPKPDGLLRVCYIIRGASNSSNPKLTEPKFNKAVRKGFFVSEWGVVRK